MSFQASLADTLMQTCKKLFMERAQKDAAVTDELDMLGTGRYISLKTSSRVIYIC